MVVRSLNARVLVVAVCVLVAVLACAAVSARAAVTHQYLPKPSEELTKGAPGAEAMAVDSGELYAVETHGTEGNRLAKFDLSSGALLSQFPEAPGLSYFEGVAVAHSTGAVYVAADEGLEGVVGVFDAAGALQQVWKGVDTAGGGFDCFDCQGTGAVAVDNSSNAETRGDVYVASPEEGVVDVFKPGAGGSEETTPVNEITGLSAPTAVAVDEANGDLLVVQGASGPGLVDVFKPTLLGEYELVRQITGTPSGAFGRTVTGVAAVGGKGNGEIYISVESISEPARNVVDQFSAEGVYVGQLTGVPPAEAFNQPRSVAVDPSSGDVLVVEGSGVDVFGPTLVIPDAITGPASDVTAESAVLAGTVKLDGAGAATCRFVWGTTPAFGEEAPCSAPVSEEEAAVHAALSQGTHSGLRPDTTYYYRLEATNGNGTNLGKSQEPEPECEGKPAPVACFTTPGAGIHGESVSEVTESAATLQAAIDPNGAATSYYFQYGADDTAGCTPSTCTNVPSVPGSVGSGSGDVPVQQNVQGLSGGTVYHYRVVASSVVPVEVAPGKLEAKLESFYGPDETLTTHSTGEFALPDDRQWQLVSPPDKQGALIEPIAGPNNLEGVIQAAGDGHAITYLTLSPTETGPAGYDNFVQVFSARGGGGWGSRDLTIPHASQTEVSVGNGFEYRFFSEDLSRAAVQPFGAFTPCENAQHESQPCISPEASEQTAFLEDTGTAVFTPLETGCPAVGVCPKAVEEHADVPPGTSFGGGECTANNPCGPRVELGTPNLGHLLVSGEEWSAGLPPAEQLQPLFLLPADEGGARVSAIAPGPGVPDHQFSDDGSIFFGYEGHIYLQDPEKQETLRLHAMPGAPSEGAESFLYASSDGSTLLFRDSAQLTSAPGGGVYECQLAEVGGQLQCAHLELTGLPFEGIFLGGSEDASALYFKAGSLIVDRREGSTWKQKTIATVSGADFPDWETELGHRTSRVSANGEWFAFMSQLSLTGYDNRDAVSGQPDEEVYLYSAATGSLVCASCNPTGARPHGVEYGINGNVATPSMPLAGGDRVWEDTTWLAANVPGWTPFELGYAAYQSRYLSDNGRLFFNASDALVPKDINGTEDVYEYEPAGVGPVGAACGPGVVSGSEVFESEREVAGGVVQPAGCVALISSGTSGQESAFLDASDSGGDVFFLTSARLAVQDADAARDVYDAHECIAVSPCLPVAPAVPPACDTEASCKAAPSPQPAIFGAPASATFSGAGNLPPALVPVVKKASKKAVRCARGKAREHGRCVKRRSLKKAAGRSARGVSSDRRVER